MSDLAASTGLTHYPGRGPFGQKGGAVMGEREGFLVALGPCKDSGSHSAVGILVRFPKSEHLDTLRAEIKAAMKDQKGRLEEAGADFARWVWTYAFRKPDAKRVADLLPPLLEAVKKAAPGFGGKCESCRNESTSRISLLNGVPSLYCANCKNDLQMKLGMAAQAYQETAANIPNGILLGVVAALAGAIAWGGVAYLLNRIFLIGAIVIGVLVAWAVIKGMGKTNLFAKVLIGLLTVGSVLFGDAIFFTLSAMKEMEVPFSGELLGLVMASFWELESDAGGAVSVLFALVGAGYAVYHARQPSFTAQLEEI